MTFPHPGLDSGGVKSPLGWTRLLGLGLLLTLALMPGALHAHVCLVALGAIEGSACCAPVLEAEEQDCCTEAPSDGPAMGAESDDCSCCLEVDLDSAERSPLVGTGNASTDLTVAPATVIQTLPAVQEPPPSERARARFARAGPRQRSGAIPLPLRI